MVTWLWAASTWVVAFLPLLALGTFFLLLFVQSFRTLSADWSLEWLDALGTVRQAIWAPAILSALVSILVWRLDQFHEIFIYVIEEHRAGLLSGRALVPGLRLILTALAIYLGSTALWFFSRRLLQAFLLKKEIEPPPGSKLEAAAIWAPRLIGLAPMLALIGGFLRAVVAKTLDEILAGAIGLQAFQTEVATLFTVALFTLGLAFSLLALQLRRHAARGWWTVQTVGVAVEVAMPVIVAICLALLLGLARDTVFMIPTVSVIDEAGTPGAAQLADALIARAYGVMLLSTVLYLVFVFAARRLRLQTDWRSIVGPGLLALGGILAWVYPDPLARLVDTVRAEDLRIPLTTYGALIYASLVLLSLLPALREQPRDPKIAELETAGVVVIGWGGIGVGLTVLAFLYFTFVDGLLYAGAGASLAQILGPVSLIFLFAGSAVCIICLLSQWDLTLDWPVIWTLVGLWVVLSVADLNEQHWVRTVEPAPDRPTLRDVGSAFKAWKAARGITDDERVILVAAQGGGHFAAFHAANLLAQIHDHAGTGFDRQLFAISGVSGGAVGGGLYAAVTEALRTRTDDPGDHVCPQMTAVAGVDAALRQDLLSPLGARLLFADVFADLLPSTLLGWRLDFVGVADRSRPIEDAVEGRLSRWAGCLGSEDNLLSRHVAGYWDPSAEPGEGPPALVFNTTEVSSGRRLVLAPFCSLEARLEDPEAAPLPGIPCSVGAEVQDQRQDQPTTLTEAIQTRWRQQEEERLAKALPGTERREMPDLTQEPGPALKTAMFLSARFPIVSPPGRIRLGVDDGEGVHVIDGGAFENSGLETAYDLIRAIHSVAPEQRVGVLLLAAEEGPPVPYGGGHLVLGEVLSPVMAFVQSWRARGLRTKDLFGDYARLASDEASLKDRQHPGVRADLMKDPDPALIEVYVNRLADDKTRAYTLSWLLAPRTFDRIACGTGVPVAQKGAALTEDGCRELVRGTPAYLCANQRDVRRLFEALGLETKEEKGMRPKEPCLGL